jgi:hypothetical protein
VGTIAFGRSVDSRITVEELQRLAGNQPKMTLQGYWVPIVTDGEGHIGCLCSQDQILMYHGTQADIEKVNQPRMSASIAAPAPKKKITPEPVGTNFLAQLAAKETRVDWDDFPAQIEKDNSVHVVTDGGANPNQGSAGWGAILNFGYCSHASNNVMELRAIVEALQTFGQFTCMDVDGFSLCQMWDH